jgi:hypothetical protein
VTRNAGVANEQSNLRDWRTILLQRNCTGTKRHSTLFFRFGWDAATIRLASHGLLTELRPFRVDHLGSIRSTVFCRSRNREPARTQLGS